MRRWPQSRVGSALAPTAGFTLLELLIATVMGSMLSAALYSFYRSQVFALRTEEVVVNLKEEADVGLDFIIRELRVAGARPASYAAGCAVEVSTVTGCAGFERLTAAGPEQITMQYDYRGTTVTDPPDGCPDDTVERITYAYDAVNGAVARTATGVANDLPVLLVGDVPSTGFTLRYFDASGGLIPSGTNPLTAEQRAAVATIEVSITSRRSHPDRRIGGEVGTTRVSAVFLRNPHC